MVLSRLFTQGMSELFTPEAMLQAMLDFEAALARAQGAIGLIPKKSATLIASSCRVEGLDLTALEDATAKSGNPAIPLVKALTARVKAKSEDAAKFVHWGATSQDVIDTASVLQFARAHAVMDAQLKRLQSALDALARKHAKTLIAGRTLMQHAVPQSFGLKVAGWLDSVTFARARLADAANAAHVLQFGGAAGTLASLGVDGMKTAEALSKDLKLPLPAAPFHARRERFADLASALGLLAGVLGKMARDISLMGATEFGEVFEPAAEGKGGSSTMPHKRNPVAATIALAAANSAPHLVASMLSGMVQEHERGVGNWHAEWRTLPELFCIVGGSLAHMLDTAEGLEVDTARMRENVELTKGLLLAESLSMSLAEKIGKAASHALVERVSKEAVAKKRHLKDVAMATPDIIKHLDKKALEKIFDPSSYLGAAPELITRILASQKKKS